MNTLERWIEFLGDKTTAKTTRGIVRHLRAHPRDAVGIAGQREAMLHGWRSRATRWTPEERTAKRLKADATFRRRMLAEYRRRCTVSATRYTPEAYDAARAARDEAARVGLLIEVKTPGIVRVKMHLGELSYRPTCKDATLMTTLGTPRRDRAPGETHWKNGVPKSYTRATDDSYVLSAARIRGATLTYWHQEPAGERTMATLTAPDGYAWDTDANGARLRRGADDYHPSATELRGGIKFIVAQLDLNATARAKAEAATQIEAAQLRGVKVLLTDSLQAGNCEAGTRAFAGRIGVDAEAGVDAARLLVLAYDKPEIVRARLAIRAAVMRHEEDIEQGVDAVRTA